MDEEQINAVGYRPAARFAAVYHLLSITHNQRLRLRAFCPSDEPPMLDSRRTRFGLGELVRARGVRPFGILFRGHPDLRRILTDYGFIGHPFRKDFPLIGNVEVRYDPDKGRVVYEPVSIEPRTLVPKVIRERQPLRDRDLKDPPEAMAEIQQLHMNFGPQHPAAHGVLRLVLEMDGEVDPEGRPAHRPAASRDREARRDQAVQPVDRLHGPARLRLDDVQRARLRARDREAARDRRRRCARSTSACMFDEITRILNHLMWLGAHGLDIGAMTMFLYCFREREDLMDCYEAVSGTRMHATYYRPGGVYRDLPDRCRATRLRRIATQKDARRG